MGACSCRSRSGRARTRVPRVSRLVASPRGGMGAEGSLAAHLRVRWKTRTLAGRAIWLAFKNCEAIRALRTG